MTGFELPPEARGFLKSFLRSHDLLSLADDVAADLSEAAKWARLLAYGVSAAARVLTSIVDAE